MVDRTREAERVLRVWARNAVAQAEELAARDPTWRTEVHPLAGGFLVLSGAGLYVNRAMAVGIDTDLTDADVDLIISRSRGLGVKPSVEVSEHTRPDTIELLRSRGFEHDSGGDVTALVRSPTEPIPGVPDWIHIRSVLTTEDLSLWQETSALGWGHVAVERRRASDAFSVSAHAVDGDGMMIAFDRADRMPIGCASVTIRNRLATLGAMSTVPHARRRGVQSAFVHHRLRLAAARGCDLAATTAATSSASARNLRRHEFTPLVTIATWTR